MRRLLVPLVAMACACGATSATARRFGADVLACPEPDVRAEMLVHDVFEVAGCGRQAVVQCPGRDVCEAVESGTAPEAPPEIGPDEQASHEQASHEQASHEQASHERSSARANR